MIGDAKTRVVPNAHLTNVTGFGKIQCNLHFLVAQVEFIEVQILMLNNPSYCSRLIVQYKGKISFYIDTSSQYSSRTRSPLL